MYDVGLECPGEIILRKNLDAKKTFFKFKKILVETKLNDFCKIK